MKKYWIVKVTSFDSGWEPVEVFCTIAKAFTGEALPSIMDFIDASELFDIPERKTTGISFSQLQAFVGDLDTAALIHRTHKGSEYYLIPFKPRTQHD